MKKSSHKKIWIVLILLALIGGAFWIWGGDDASPAPTGDANLYNHSNPNFSLQMPEGFSAVSLPEAEGETILVKSSNSNDQSPNNAEFQIYLRPIDEEIEITPEVIKQDIPDMKVENPKNIKVGESEALQFESENDAGQKTAEVWFVHSGYLYQITAEREVEPVLMEIIKSWKW